MGRCAFRVAVVVAFVALVVSGRAETIRFGFDDPAELESWQQVSGQLDLEDTWVVEDGVLKITDATENSFARIRNFEFHHGTISYRIRLVGSAAAWTEAGTGYRVGRMPREATDLDGPPGFYAFHYSVQRGPSDSGLSWFSRRATPESSFGYIREAPFWDGLAFEDWHTVRVNVAGGEHRIAVAADGDPVPFMRVSATQQAVYYDDELLPHSSWADNERLRDAPLADEPGDVGIFYFIDGGEADTEVHIDDFEVTTTLSVEPGGKAATTWGHMKSAAVVR